MRELLYRGKRIDNGEWVYGYVARFRNVRNQVYTAIIQICDDETKECNIQDLVPVLDETICEYTGLTDKRDELIYEGDIVKIDGKYLRYVAYSGEHTAFCAMHYIDKQQSELTGTLGDGYDNYKRSYEVVGNIYDNPELLTNKND